MCSKLYPEMRYYWRWLKRKDVVMMRTHDSIALRGGKAFPAAEAFPELRSALDLETTFMYNYMYLILVLIKLAE